MEKKVDGISIIIPVHGMNKDNDILLLNKALESVKQCQQNYEDNLCVKLIGDNNTLDSIRTNKNFNDSNVVIDYCINNVKTDFCSQINTAVNQYVDTEYFSILEYDDEYAPTWFNSVKEYHYTNEDVSVFLPINVQMENSQNIYQFCNELVWANEFSNELGFIDLDCLENYTGFNLTGGVFNTNDFKRIGGLKSSIEVAFNYEFLLRLTNKKLKAFVVPKEGYYHLLNREGSLTDHYSKTLTNELIKQWFNIAKTEYHYTEDRCKTPIVSSSEELK